MPAFSLSIRRYATNEAGCWARFTFSGGWAEIAFMDAVSVANIVGLAAMIAGRYN
jgi:hypothetical protein